jgi:hypothetical protein
LVGGAFAGDFRLAAVGPFGETLTACRVESFRIATSDGSPGPEYRGLFQKLTAAGLPDGNYSAVIICSDERINEQITVDGLHRFHVAAQSGRITIPEHKKPSLIVHLPKPAPNGETWWITLRAMYDERSYTEDFHASTGDARIVDPEPGSYAVSVLSDQGYVCSRDIDLVENAELWTFDPTKCQFAVDTRAHVVTDQDRKEGKQTGWYLEKKREVEQLFRALESAAKSDPANNLPEQ